MKKIYWLGGALAVSTITLGLWLATSNAVAAVWIEHFPAKKLSASNKSKAATAFHCIAPGVAVADVERFRCSWMQLPIKDAKGEPTGELGPRFISCKGSGVKTVSADEYILALSQGLDDKYLSRNGNNVTVPASTGDLIVSEDCTDEWKAFVDAVWPGTWDTLLSWFCARNPRDASQIDCEADNAKQGTSVEFLDAGGGKEGGPALRGVIQ